jgi:hypothetical protein
VIEQDRFPPGRLERQFSGSWIAFRRAGARAAALTLRQRRHRAGGDGRAQRHQEVTARQMAAVKSFEQRCKCVGHEGVSRITKSSPQREYAIDRDRFARLSASAGLPAA